MKSDNIITIMILFFIQTSNLFPQSAFLEKGMNGIGAEVGYYSNDNVIGFMEGLGFSLYGEADLGFSIGQIFSSQKINGFALTASAISPSITGFALKQDSTIPISISLSGLYEHDKYSTEAIYNSDISLVGDGLSVGLMVYRDIRLDQFTKLQLVLGAAYLNGQTKYEVKNSRPIILSNIDESVFHIGCALVYQTKSFGNIILSPGIAFDKNRANYQ